MPRLIYSLVYELECPAPQRSELIVPLRPDGQSPTVTAQPPKQRVIDLRPGDWCEHASIGRVRIKAIRAFRDAHFSADRAPELQEGYVVGMNS